MNRSFLSIVCYVVAGFFVSMTMMLAFTNVPPSDNPEALTKPSVLGIFLVPAVLALVAGLSLSAYVRWQRDMGVVFISAALIMLFFIFTFVCMLATPEIAEVIVTDERKDFFSDTVTGSMYLALFMCVGGLLVWSDRAQNG